MCWHNDVHLRVPRKRKKRRKFLDGKTKEKKLRASAFMREQNHQRLCKHIFRQSTLQVLRICVCLLYKNTLTFGQQYKNFSMISHISRDIRMLCGHSGALLVKIAKKKLSTWFKLSTLPSLELCNLIATSFFFSFFYVFLGI